MPKCRWVAPAGRRLAGVSRASVRPFVKPRPDYTCSNDTPALQPPATTAPVRAVPCWQDTTLMLRGGAMRVRLRIESVLLQAGTRMRVYVHEKRVRRPASMECSVMPLCCLVHSSRLTPSGHPKLLPPRVRDCIRRCRAPIASSHGVSVLRPCVSTASARISSACQALCTV